MPSCKARGPKQAAAEARAAWLGTRRGPGQRRSRPARALQAASAQAIEAAEARISAARWNCARDSASVQSTGSGLRRSSVPYPHFLAGLAVMANARRCSRSPTRRSRRKSSVRLRSTQRSGHSRAVRPACRPARRGQRTPAGARGRPPSLRRSRNALARAAAVSPRSKRGRSARWRAAAKRWAPGDVALPRARKSSGSGCRGEQTGRGRLPRACAAEPAPARPDKRLRAPEPRSYISCLRTRRARTGLGAVSASGVRSRGLTLATAAAQRSWHPRRAPSASRPVPRL